MTHAPVPERVQCCIAGCGPAGAVLGFLLARAGVEVLVLEKHADFLRDFRGDTLHTSTLEILDELGLAERFLGQVPHSTVTRLGFEFGGGFTLGADFERLRGRTKFPYIAFVPQWDFLRFVTQEAQRYPTFHLAMQAEAVELLWSDGQVRGARYRTPQGEHTVEAPLTVGADGRGSATRAAAGLPLAASSPPMDVLWFRISRRPDEPNMIDFRLTGGQFVGLIDRRSYWQVAWVIPKGAFDEVRQAGLEAFRARVVEHVPTLVDRVGELEDWDQIKLLTVRADRLRRWYRPGYLAIGDAAHVMSPVGGVGINVAIQDAVEAANRLWQPLRDGTLTTRHLARVQRRRELAVWITQLVQGQIQERLLKPGLESGREVQAPALMRLLLQVPGLRDLPPRFVAFGVARPHVRTPALAPTAAPSVATAV